MIGHFQKQWNVTIGFGIISTLLKVHLITPVLELGIKIVLYFLYFVDTNFQ